MGDAVARAAKGKDAADYNADRARRRASRHNRGRWIDFSSPIFNRHQPPPTAIKHAMKLLAPIPILRMFSIEKAYAFYCDYLGFKPDWEHRFEADLPLYVQLHRDALVLHLSEHHGDGTPGTALFLPVEDIEAFHRELAAKPYAYARPGVETLPWGRQMQIHDPFGNILRFCELS
jgi:catechol 2,3-dioxygenase-like lactoylglutathione lyase family enzyme